MRTDSPWGRGMTSTSADVAIIGGGLMGCFSAYFLRRRGRSVAVIEKGSACAAASGVNFGNLRLQGRAPAGISAVASGAGDLGGPCPPHRRGLRHRSLRARVSGICGKRSAQAGAAPRTTRVRPVLTWSFSTGPRRAAAGPSLSRVRDGRFVVEARRHRRSRARLARRRAAGATGRRTAASSIPRLSPCERDGPRGSLCAPSRGRTVTCGQRRQCGRRLGRGDRPAIRRARADVRGRTAAFTIEPQNAYTGPSLHAVDGTLLLRPGRDGEAVAGFFPRVKADLATGTGHRSAGSRRARACPSRRGRAGSRAHARRAASGRASRAICPTCCP